MPNPLIAPKDIVDHLGRGGTADPGMLQACDAASDVVRLVAECEFNRSIRTYTFDGTGTDAIVLPELPVNSAGTVTVNGGTVSDYTLSSNGILFRGTAGVDPRPVWPMGRQNVQVIADVGYDDQDIPRSVRKVALDVAVRMVVQGPLKQETVGPVSASYAVNNADLSSTEMLILRKFRRT
jgi:hypothetical protein